jgi:hypothetical protein
MIDEKKLRVRILSTLNIGLLAAAFDLAACGSSDEPAGKARLNQVTCQNGPVDVQCWAPHASHFAVGNLPPGTPVPTEEPIFDQNGCQVKEQAADGCCNHPVAGPEFESGECCYAFCAGACCGRPLLVDGGPRVAPVVRRSDWTVPFDGAALDGLGATVRRNLADEWLADARMEHASIASFARFTMDLLAFGAPPDLVEDAQRAGLDEVMHSRICFGVASLYAGTPCGPGALDLVGAKPSATLAEAALAAFHEGCIGETTAALLAGERARAAESPELRGVYQRIAEDESRHAELAFRFVAWAIAEGGGEVRNAVSSACAGLRTSGTPVRSRGRDPVLRAHGRLAEWEIRDVERRALSDVIAPCLVALVASGATPSKRRFSVAADACT